MTTMTISASRRRVAPARGRCAYETGTPTTPVAEARPGSRRPRTRARVRPSQPAPAGRTQGAIQGSAVGTRVATSAPAASSPVTLTRRGRLVLSCAALVAVVAGLGAGVSLFDSGAAAATGSTSGPVLTTVTVEPGDTLWGIARELAPGTDPRDMVSRLRALNDVSGGLASGQELVVPVTG